MTSRAAQFTILLGALFSTGSLLAPWSLNGRVHRSGFAVAGALRASGLASGGWLHALSIAIIALPSCCALALAIAIVGRKLASCWVAALVGGAVLAASVLALATPSIQAQVGAWIGGVLGAGTVLFSFGETIRTLLQPRAERIGYDV